MSLPEEKPDYDVKYYIPEFMWNLWLESCPVDMSKHSPETFSVFPITGLHVFDVYKNELSTGLNKHPYSLHIFDPIKHAVPQVVNKPEWEAVNTAFSALEKEAEMAIRSLIQQVNTKQKPSAVYGLSSSRKNPAGLGKPQLSLGKRALQSLQKYLMFLRFRNVKEFWRLLKLTNNRYHEDMPSVLKENMFKEHLDICNLLESFTCFLSQDFTAHQDIPFIAECIHKNYRKLKEVDLCLGVSPEPDEYIFSPTCFGDIGGNENQDDVYNYFFTLSPHFTIYIIIDCPFPLPPDEWGKRRHFLHPSAQIQSIIEHDMESSMDVYQRNALLLQTYPPYLMFISSRSMIRTLTYYNERRWLPENLDYSKLLRGCREESVTHTLLVKASIEVIDLTDDVVLAGEHATCHGSFADVWKGVWSDRMEKKDKLVALKVLRANLVGYAQEKLLQRLKKEVKAWYRLEHPHIAKLHGIMQLPNTLAMVSPWCGNGTVIKYLKEINPEANRIQLCFEIASGVEYLHKSNPLVVHGDLKGCNILIDNEGHAVITDFGLAKVKEEVIDVLDLPSSLFGGSTRWMAPELLLSQVEDDGKPSFTTHSDVYAFASVCLEVLTGELPYANRRNDHGVTLDIMRGLKPMSGLQFVNDNPKLETLWSLLNKCWDQIAFARPNMTRMRGCLDLIRH